MPITTKTQPSIYVVYFYEDEFKTFTYLLTTHPKIATASQHTVNTINQFLAAIEK